MGGGRFASLINKERLLYFGIIAIVTIFFYFGSALNPLSIRTPVTDEQVWMYIVNGILNGQLPYQDIFDHKGTFLYLIYLVGYIIGFGSTIGIWILAILSALVGLYFNYNIGYLVSNSEKIAFSSTLLIIFLLGYFTWFAGQKMLFALPFIFISLYLFTRHILNRSSRPKLEMIIIGICGGCVLLIAPTITILWLVIGIWILIDLVREKEIVKSCRLLLYIFLGVIIAITPHLIWLYSTGIFGNFIECYLYYNLGYSTTDGRSVFWNGLDLLKIVITNAAIVFAELALVLNISKKREADKQIISLSIFSTIYLFMSVILTCFIGIGMDHYLAIILPCLSIPFAWGFQSMHYTLCRTTSEQWKQCFVLVLCAGLIGIGGIWCGLSDVKGSNISLTEYEKNVQMDELKIQNIITSYTNDKEYIQVFSYGANIYLDTNTIAASRFIFLPPGFKKFEDEILEDLIENNPKIIVEEKRRNIRSDIPMIMDYIQTNYVSIMDTSYYSLYLDKGVSMQ